MFKLFQFIYLIKKRGYKFKLLKKLKFYNFFYI